MINTQNRVNLIYPVVIICISFLSINYIGTFFRHLMSILHCNIISYSITIVIQYLFSIFMSVNWIRSSEMKLINLWLDNKIYF